MIETFRDIDYGRGINATVSVIDMNSSDAVNRLVEVDAFSGYIGSHISVDRAVRALIAYKHESIDVMLSMFDLDINMIEDSGHIEYLQSAKHNIMPYNRDDDVECISSALKYIGELSRMSTNSYSRVVLKRPHGSIVEDVMVLMDRVMDFNSSFDVDSLDIMFEGVSVKSKDILQESIKYDSDIIENVNRDDDARESYSNMLHHMSSYDEHTLDDIKGDILAMLNKPFDLEAYLKALFMNDSMSKIRHYIVFNPMINKVFVWSLKDNK